MAPKAWRKSERSVFAKTKQVFGPGHGSFVKSRDGKEDWLVYHAAKHSGAGWNRMILMQKFGWSADGSPNFGEPLPPGAIYNSNRYALRTLLEGMGCEVRDLGAVEDRLDATCDALRRAAADNDLVITSGGVSVGEEDHVKPAVEAEGELDMWKIAIKPGKPLAFGKIRKEGGHAWFIGLPGNPVAAFVTCLMMVRPFVMRLQGIAQVAPRILNLPCASAWNKPDGARLEFLRGRINEAGTIELYRNQGSAVATSLCWSDGLILNPPGNCIAAGDTVRFVSFAELLA